MKCPNCGSERIQFGTNTSGSGYSASNGCCGFILLGPLGLLCGACGSDVTTDEFWICQDCGNKFTNSEVKKAHELEVENRKNYELCKIEAEKALSEYGSKSALKELYDEAKGKFDLKYADFNNYVDEYVEENFSDPEICKRIKIIDSKHGILEIILSILLAIITIIIFIAGDILSGMVGIIITILVISIRPIIKSVNAKKLVRHLASKNSKIIEMYDDLTEAAIVGKNYYEKLDKIQFCEHYENENGKSAL